MAGLFKNVLVSGTYSIMAEAVDDFGDRSGEVAVGEVTVTSFPLSGVDRKIVDELNAIGLFEF